MKVSDSATSWRSTPDFEDGFEPAAKEDWDESQETSAVRRLDSAHAEDDEYSQIEPPHKGTRGQPTALTSGLKTAAELLATSDRPKISPNAFAHGMLVQHPQYGAGTIIALSGNGPKRTATVRFINDNQERKFRLLFSDLTPAQA
jgi:DNA helicase-2/ATP-dependent DNA helicase PcrA